jgi:hypothetical protein
MVPAATVSNSVSNAAPVIVSSHGPAITVSDTVASVPVSSTYDGGHCNPLCTWSCDSPTCEEECTPVCKTPKCETRCSGLSLNALAGCSLDCTKPQCRVECPKSPCVNGKSCPQCTTQCSEPQCQMKCPKTAQDCQNVCEQPVCDWKCNVPQNCPKPKCKMLCEEPPSCQSGSFVQSLPSLAAGQTAVAAFPVRASHMSMLSAVGAKIQQDVAVRSIAHGDSEVQERLVSLPVIS